MTIGDILGTDGELRSAENIKMTWKVKCDFLLHMRLKNKIKLIFQHKNRSNENSHPQMSHLLYGIDICNRGNKNTYINIMGKDFSVDAIKDKWCERLNDEISINTIQNAFKNTKNYASSAYQYYNQFKLIHGRTVHNQLLKKMNIIDSEKCLFCKDEVETIEHAYLYCANSSKLWLDTITWVRNIYSHHFIISEQEKNFGSHQKDKVTDMIIMSVKDVIYQKRKEGKEMVITDVKQCLQKNLRVQKAKEILTDTLETFEEKWNSFITDLRSDIYTKNCWYKI